MSVQWVFGCDVACADSGGFAAAVEAAKNVDAVIMVMGLDQRQERYLAAVTVNVVPEVYCIIMHSYMQILM